MAARIRAFVEGEPFGVPLHHYRGIANAIGEPPSTVWDALDLFYRSDPAGPVRYFPGRGWWARSHEEAFLRWLKNDPAQREVTVDWMGTKHWKGPGRWMGRWKEDPVEGAVAFLRAVQRRPAINFRRLAQDVEAVFYGLGGGGPIESANRMRLSLGDHDVGRELLRRHARFPLKAWDWQPPDEPAPTGTRWVVWVGPEGVSENAEVFVPHGPAFRRGVPAKLPELTAKELVERAEVKAKEVEDPLPPHFRYATAAEEKAAEVEDPKPAHFTLVRNAVPVSP